MADSKDLSKNLAPLLQELKNSARLMADATEKLSKTGLDKFTEELKKTLKQQGLINDADAAAIKDAATLQKVLGKLEDQYATILKIEKEAEALKRKQLSSYKLNAANTAKADKASKEYIADKLAEHDITVDMIDVIKKGIPVLRDEADARAKLIAGTDGLTKSYEVHKNKLIASVKSFGSLDTAVALSKKAFFQFYDQMNRLTSKGMLGALGQINSMAFSLAISAADLEEIMTKNRDVVNQMGGGLIGMKAFGDELGNIREDLKYLGEGATKAAARMYESSKRAGLQRKDGDAYNKNIKESNKQMKLFSGAFGDTADEYANMIDGLNEEARNRGILNNLSKEDIFLSQREQRERIQNLKFMGLNNQQIIEMNQRMSQLVNPESNDFAERATSALNAQAAVQETIKMLMGSNRPGDQAQGMALQGSQGVLNKIYQEISNGNGDAAKQLAESEAGVEALKQLEKGIQATNRDADQFGRAFRNNLLSGASSINNLLRPTGADAATAEATGRAVSRDKREETIKQAEILTAASGTAADSLDKMTQAVKKVEAILANPFVAASIAAVSAILALSGAAAQAAIALRTMGLGGALGGLGGAGRMEKALGVGGKLLGGAAIGLGAYDAWQGVNQNKSDEASGKISENQSNRKSGEAIGGFGGAAAGAAVGAGFGSAFGGFGAIPGALIGGAVGYFGGGAAGGAIGGQFGNKSTPAANSSATQTTSSGENAIASVVSSGPGWLVVKRPSGNTEKLTGSRNWRNNNPGNLEYNSSTMGMGAIGSDGRFAIFPSLEAGKKAQGKLLFEGKNYKDLTLSSAISRYAPPSENNTAAYQQSVLNSVGGQNKRMGDFSAQEQQQILSSMSKVEGFKPGIVSPYGGGGDVSNAVSSASTVTPANTTGRTAPPPAPPQGSDPAIGELVKQTNLLTLIAQNTGASPRTQPSQKGYMKDPAVVMSGVHG